VIRAFPAATIALVVLATPAPGSAHAIVVEASPVHDSTLERAPDRVTLRFNSKIEKRFTRLTLSVGDGRPVPVALLTHDDPSGPDRLVIPLRPLRPGIYVLRYRVLAVDGHITEGALRFTIGPGR
jgi:methionine-rich copper-binding protein CopC